MKKFINLSAVTLFLCYFGVQRRHVDVVFPESMYFIFSYFPGSMRF